MVYIRGNTADYDGWVDEGAPGWSYGEMLPYFIKSEGNERGDARYHGHAGPMSVQDGRSVHPLVDRLIDAALSSGYQPTDDFNAASQPRSRALSADAAQRRSVQRRVRVSPPRA